MYSGRSIPKDIKLDKHYGEIMTNLVKKDKEFVHYLNSIKKDQKNNQKKRKKKEQSDDFYNNINNYQIFLPLINLSKELRKKENEKIKQNILIVNHTKGDNDDEESFENEINYYNNTDEATYNINNINKDNKNPMIKQIKSQLNLNENKNNYLNTDIEKSILPVVKTNFENNNNNYKNKKNQKKKKLRSSSMYLTEINLVENPSKL